VVERPITTLAGEHSVETEVKRSRFVARARRADAVEEAGEWLERAADPGATHNCWAYRIGDAYRFSDDGEPGGTAGRPIHGAIESAGLDHVTVLVTRFFGGIKLGAGGLARAYGGSAAECLRGAERIELRPRVRSRLDVPFSEIGAVHTVLERVGATKLGERYGQGGVALEVELDAERVGELDATLGDATRGRVRGVPIDSEEGMG
jgi:putative IMPACT (imprinted ancient) family translation regulator